MDQTVLKKLKRKILFLFPLTFIILATILMLPAGSLKYRQGWIFCAVVIFPAIFITFYFIKKSPELLERRMKFKEKELTQKTIIQLGSIISFLGFLIPGFDFRFSWSVVPIWLVIISNLLFLAGYFLMFLSFKENSFAGRTIEIFEGQKVIETGPYAIVRHPMYTGIIPMFLFAPLALGSFWAVIPFIPVCAGITIRILNEEKILKQGLPGYSAYCEKVRYRLIPFVW